MANLQSSQRPVIDDRFESSVRGIYVIGDLAGAPVVKIAMEQGYAVARTIAARVRNTQKAEGYDVIVAGAGAAGLNAALEAQGLGLRVLVLEKGQIANTINDFPEGKWIYAEPESAPAKGKLWFDAASKEDLITRWRESVRENRLEIKTGEGLEAIEKNKDGGFWVRTAHGIYQTQTIVIATGQHGTPRKLGVPGEERKTVFHAFYSAKMHQNDAILVVGGGNNALETALLLAKNSSVTLSYRGDRFDRPFRDNRQKLDEAEAAGKLQVLRNSTVTQFGASTCTLTTKDGPREIPYDQAFVLIGTEAPTGFLRSLGLKLENDWNVSRFAWLALSFSIAYTIYGVKQGAGHEYWPYRGWGYDAFSFFHRPWSFWYTVLYTLVVTVFGIQAMKRWGIDRKDKFQIWRYVSLIGFQWTFFFLIPEFLVQWTAHTRWVGAALAHDPGNAWRAYGLIYAWPLFFYTFFSAPSQVWVVWGVLLSFVIMPILVMFHGKRYCSWICGCGGLAETLGDRWRHLAPKGNTSIAWERMNAVVLAGAVAVTLLVLGKDAVAAFRMPAAGGLQIYHLIADTWLVGILPVALYPFFGGKVWCRYWCPLAKMMELFSAVFARFHLSRFAISSNDKCIACGECSRNCQVGIDVMKYALRQEILDNSNSSCIGCGICVTVCPMDVLSFGREPVQVSRFVQISSAR